MLYSRNLDALDAKILHALQENARITVSDISKKTGIPHTTIRLRIKRLENIGVVKGYVPLLDLKKLGYTAKAIVLIKTSPEEKYEKLADTFKKMENVRWIYSISGRMTGALMVIAKDMRELHETVLKIRRVPGVVDEETIVVMEEVKEGAQVPLA